VIAVNDDALAGKLRFNDVLAVRVDNKNPCVRRLIVGACLENGL
jgi:hypothetical protein